jgi:hypothetical protein
LWFPTRSGAGSAADDTAVNNELTGGYFILAVAAVLGIVMVRSLTTGQAERWAHVTWAGAPTDEGTLVRPELLQPGHCFNGLELDGDELLIGDFDSRWQFVSFWPDEDRWTRDDGRHALCALVDPRLGPIEGSLRDSET